MSQVSFTVKPVETESSQDQLLCTEYTGVRFIQVKLTKIAYFRNLFKIRFLQDFSLFRVGFGFTVNHGLNL